MKKKNWIIIITIIIISLFYVAWVYKYHNEISNSSYSKNSYGSSLNKDPENVSVIQLIAEPEKYDGKLVRVIGVFCIESGSKALFLSKDDYKYNVTKNAVGIGLNLKVLEANEKELEKFNGHYVLIEGTFDKNNNGSYGLLSGSVDNICRILNMNNIIRK